MLSHRPAHSTLQTLTWWFPVTGCVFLCSVTPIFTASSVSGESLDLLKVFFNIIPPLSNSKEQEDLMQQLTEFQVQKSSALSDHIDP